MITTNTYTNPLSFTEFISINDNINPKSIIHSIRYNGKYTGIFVIEHKKNFSIVPDKYSIFNTIKTTEHNSLSDAVSFVSDYINNIKKYFC